MDMVANIPYFPVPGETIIGDSLAILPGGKGANQAVALSRLGNFVSMFGIIGKDQWGDAYKNIFQREGVHTEYIKVDKNIHTGIALIEVERQGQNRIIVIPGTNSLVDKNYIDEILSIIIKDNAAKKTVLLQLEIPLDAVCHTLTQLVGHKNIISILDPAPARKLPKEIYKTIDYIIPNETETSILTGVEINKNSDIEIACRKLLSYGCKHVIMKAGEQGAYYTTPTKLIQISPKEKVKTVDTTAAGDTFNAGFAHALQQNLSIKEAIKFANKVASLSTTKRGAQSAMPLLSEIVYSD